MIPVVRKMSVVRCPGVIDQPRPMIRLSGNSFLTSAGFSIGTAIEVSYYPDRIIINKLNNENIPLQIWPFITIPNGREGIRCAEQQEASCA